LKEESHALPERSKRKRGLEEEEEKKKIKRGKKKSQKKESHQPLLHGDQEIIKQEKTRP